MPEKPINGGEVINDGKSCGGERVKNVYKAPIPVGKEKKKRKITLKDEQSLFDFLHPNAPV